MSTSQLLLFARWQVTHIGEAVFLLHFKIFMVEGGFLPWFSNAFYNISIVHAAPAIPAPSKISTIPCLHNLYICYSFCLAKYRIPAWSALISFRSLPKYKAFFIIQNHIPLQCFLGFYVLLPPSDMFICVAFHYNVGSKRTGTGIVSLLGTAVFLMSRIFLNVYTVYLSREVNIPLQCSLL